MSAADTGLDRPADTNSIHALGHTLRQGVAEILSTTLRLAYLDPLSGVELKGRGYGCGINTVPKGAEFFFLSHTFSARTPDSHI